MQVFAKYTSGNSSYIFLNIICSCYQSVNAIHMRKFGPIEGKIYLCLRLPFLWLYPAVHSLYSTQELKVLPGGASTNGKFGNFSQEAPSAHPQDSKFSQCTSLLPQSLHVLRTLVLKTAKYHGKTSSDEITYKEKLWKDIHPGEICHPALPSVCQS